MEHIIFNKLSTWISPECESEKHREFCSDSSKCACECHGPETLDNINKDMKKERIRRKVSPPEPTPSNVK
jgi:hypothetical protein